MVDTRVEERRLGWFDPGSPHCLPECASTVPEDPRTDEGLWTSFRVPNLLPKPGWTFRHKTEFQRDETPIHWSPFNKGERPERGVEGRLGND